MRAVKKCAEMTGWEQSEEMRSKDAGWGGECAGEMILGNRVSLGDGSDCGKEKGCKWKVRQMVVRLE